MILAPAQVFPVADTSTDAIVWVGRGILHGWAFYNASETVRAVVAVTDGAGGPTIGTFSFCPGESARDWLAGTGVELRTGLYLDILAGAVSVTFWFRPDDSGQALVPFDVHAAIERLEDAAFGG